MAERASNKLNGVIKGAVEQAQQEGIAITFVPAALFSRHALCDNQEPWINEISFETNPGTGKPEPAVESFHPHAYRSVHRVSEDV